MADLMEEIARIYGYERIPETRMADELPPQRGNPALEQEERVRDLLVEPGLAGSGHLPHDLARAREPPAACRADRADDQPYVRIANPIAGDRNVLRRSLLSSLLEVVERNARLRERHGPVRDRTGVHCLRGGRSCRMKRRAWRSP